MNIKVGDVVRIDDWDNMFRLYGMTGADFFHTPKGLYVPDDMSRECGKEHVVKAIHRVFEDGVAYFSVNDSSWTFSTELILDDFDPLLISLTFDDFLNGGIVLDDGGCTQ
jgi:hypothetical protein